LGLEQHDPAFRDNEIDAEVLPGLAGEDLKDLGVTVVGHRRKGRATPSAAPINRRRHIQRRSRKQRDGNSG
jgi:hypothetical protein